MQVLTYFETFRGNLPLKVPQLRPFVHPTYLHCVAIPTNSMWKAHGGCTNMIIWKPPMYMANRREPHKYVTGDT